MKEKQTFIGTKIPAEQHKKLSSLAAKNQRSIGAEIRIAIENHMKGLKK